MALAVRQQERGEIAACDESAFRFVGGGLFRETIRPVTCLKQQARKIGRAQVYEVYE
jgi:hypothetical protein